VLDAITLLVNKNKAGSLAVIEISSLRPMTLRPILSDSLLLSTSLNSYLIFQIYLLYIISSLKISVLDMNFKLYFKKAPQHISERLGLSGSPGRTTFTTSVWVIKRTKYIKYWKK